MPTTRETSWWEWEWGVQWNGQIEIFGLSDVQAQRAENRVEAINRQVLLLGLKGLEPAKVVRRKVHRHRVVTTRLDGWEERR